jgi:hypothetical protein
MHLDQFTSPLAEWSDLQLADLVFAYRKAKADCFFERTLSLAQDFADYEHNLEANLDALLRRLHSNKRAALAEDSRLLGSTHLVAKKLSIEPRKEASGGKANAIGHAYFSDKRRAFEHVSDTHKLTAEFRIASRFPVDLHVLSALWVNRIGHRFDACLKDRAYGSRVRRYGDDGAPNTGSYHIKALGSMAPYFLPYRSWRENGLSAMQSALDEDQKIVAVTLDIRNYFHRIDPRFILDPAFHAAIGLGGGGLDSEGTAKTALTPVERELTEILLGVLLAWSEHASQFIRESQIGASTEETSRGIGGLPIGVTACRLMANVLLCEWDKQIVECLSPIYYGRYVDDMFLVLRDPENVSGPGVLMDRIATFLPKGMLKSEGGGERHIQLGTYQGKTELVLQDDKHRIFFLHGRAGLDLLSVIRREIVDLSSERRLMPDPDALTRSPAARALTAADDARESADSLRRAEGLSIRRMGWAIQLRSAETLALDLPSEDEEWKQKRLEFYRFARDHVLRPECLLEHMDYLPRLLGLAVASRDWPEALSLYDAARDALRTVQAACRGADNGLKLNGHSVGSDSDAAWALVHSSFEQMTREAVLRAWPWVTGSRGSRPSSNSGAAEKLRERLSIDVDDLHARVVRLTESDLGRTPLKEHRRLYGLPAQDGLPHDAAPAVVSCFDADDEIAVMRDFLRKAKHHRSIPSGDSRLLDGEESLLPYLFPTRPFTPREIAEIDPRCVGIAETNEKSTLAAVDAAEHWAKLVRALRGSWTRLDSNALDETPAAGGDDVRVVSIGLRRSPQRPLLCLANLHTELHAWHAAAEDKPSLTLKRYRQLVRLVNSVLRADPRPQYLLLPELAIPRQWVSSVVNRLLQSNISVIAGVEYEHLPGGRVHNDALLALTDDRLGFDSSVLIWQHKSAPAPGEEEELLRLHQRGWSPPSVPDAVRVYRHHDFDFGVLICSELQNIRYREAFQGEVDSLIILAWNKDLETFSALIESAALDVHAYVSFVNNRAYGDSRVRCPAKEPHLRDLCRIRGGKDDYAVIVELDVTRLRRFQSRAKNWPRDNDPYKSVPQGFIIAPRRREIPDDVEPRAHSRE